MERSSQKSRSKSHTDNKQIQCQQDISAKSRPSPILLDLETDIGLISFQEYSRVCSIWESYHRGHRLIKEKERIPMELSYYNIGTLRKKSKLNDAVINSYLFLIQESIRQQEKPIKILDSWVSASILKFQKSKKSLLRTFLKLQLSGTQTLLIILHIHNHWIFVQRSNCKLYIYDSLRKSKAEYQQFYELKQLKYVLDWIFPTKHILEVVQNYPQQENKHDCGIMMLLGILDVVEGKFAWSFEQGKTVYWRARVASQLLKERLMVSEAFQQQAYEQDKEARVGNRCTSQEGKYDDQQ